MPAEDRLHSFAAVADERARALVLGSFPSVRSLADVEYYAHPQNAFWPIMGELFGAGPDLPYQERLRVLAEARVALWDVARVCHRDGSADSTMRAIEPNDISGLIARHCPDLGAIFCNGRKAEDLFRRLVLPTLNQGLDVHYLPSTSPAHAGMRRADKLRHWRALETWLRPCD